LEFDDLFGWIFGVFRWDYFSIKLRESHAAGLHGRKRQQAAAVQGL